MKLIELHTFRVQICALPLSNVYSGELFSFANVYVFINGMKTTTTMTAEPAANRRGNSSFAAE